MPFGAFPSLMKNILSPGQTFFDMTGHARVVDPRSFMSQAIILRLVHDDRFGFHDTRYDCTGIGLLIRVTR